MPLFSFLIHDGSPPAECEPLELATYKDARKAAVALASDVLRDMNGAFWDRGECVIDVADENGLILCSLIVVGVDAPPLASG